MMCDPNQDGNWESDSTIDYSKINNRLESFYNSSWSKKVSPLLLAEAGFIFTGVSDRVRCFSCQKTVENWSQEDEPVDRHIQVIVYVEKKNSLEMLGNSFSTF